MNDLKACVHPHVLEQKKIKRAIDDFCMHDNFQMTNNQSIEVVIYLFNDKSHSI